MTDIAPAPPSSRLERWISAVRPRTLTLAITPVFAGIVLALAERDTWAPWTAMATLLAAVALQIGTNLHNDAADFERGTDTPDRLGPPRATAQGWFTAHEVRRAAHLAFITALMLGLTLVVRGGWPILLLGLGSIAAGYAYTSGPRPIAYGPLGELFVLIFFGLAATLGTFYLQTLTLSVNAALLGLALGFPAAAVLLLNNYRDFASDRRAGRHTLCHVIGQARARWLYAVLVLAPLPLLTLLPGSAWILLPALPVALWLSQRIWRTEGRALNDLLSHTALYQLLLVLLWGGSLLSARIQFSSSPALA